MKKTALLLELPLELLVMVLSWLPRDLTTLSQLRGVCRRLQEAADKLRWWRSLITRTADLALPGLAGRTLQILVVGGGGGRVGAGNTAL